MHPWSEAVWFKWYQLLKKTMIELGFKPSAVDPCLFIKKEHDGPIQGVAAVHVDDLIMTGAKAVIDRHVLRKNLGDAFEIHDLGAAEEHLGVKIEYDAEKGELALSQPAYTQELSD